MVKWLSCMLILFVAVGAAQSGNLLSENFDNIATLPGTGWALVNNSSPVGSTGWFQGNPGVFAAQAGGADSYVAANFNNAAFGGNISNWLLSPELNLSNGAIITFYTRTEAGAPFPDQLELRLSLNGASTNVGSSDTSVGDFTTLLLTINPALSVGGYPEDWTVVTASVSGLSGTSGRFAFRYFVTDTDTNADYIGIDTVSVNTASVPEPSTLLLLGAGIISLAGLRRRIAGRK
jgi:hypothetical protein